MITIQLYINLHVLMKIQSQKREMQASEALQRWDGNGFKAC